MPSPTTLRDVEPHLENLRHLIAMTQVKKNDLASRVEIAEHIEALNRFDIETITIDTHSLGQVGTIMADTVRASCAEILSRLQAFWTNSFSVLDKQERLKNDDFDDYEINHLFREVQSFDVSLRLYKDSLMSVGKLQVPEDNEMNQYEKEIGRCHLEESREKWLKAKRQLVLELERSLKFDEYLDKPKQPLYSNLRTVCSRIYKTVERYFPPCEIRLTSKLRDPFIEYIQLPNGSYAGPSIIHKIPGAALADSKQLDSEKDSQKDSSAKRQWDMELFPMILISELYEVCSDVFESTETQFHSSLNLHCKHEPIRIKPKQTIKACYLISKLYEIVPAKHKTAWREDILNHLGIEWSYYEKKYCHPRGGDASASSRAYADEVDEIFKNHRKRA